MKVVPFRARVILQLAAVTLLPVRPLILLAVPIGNILKVMTQTVFQPVSGSGRKAPER